MDWCSVSDYLNLGDSLPESPWSQQILLHTTKLFAHRCSVLFTKFWAHSWYPWESLNWNTSNHMNKCLCFCLFLYIYFKQLSLYRLPQNTNHNFLSAALLQLSVFTLLRSTSQKAASAPAANRNFMYLALAQNFQLKRSLYFTPSADLFNLPWPVWCGVRAISLALLHIRAARGQCSI